MTNNQIHILLVEDNPGDAALTRELLAGAKGMALDVAWVETLSEAIGRLSSDGIDLVLLDLGLPDCAGLETLRRVHAAAPGTVVVVLSGLSDEETALRSVQEGAQDYLIKGQVDAGMLALSIRYALGRGQSQEALRRAHADLESRIRQRTADLLEANQALRESQHLLQSLLDNLSTVIFVKDLQGRYLLVNPAYERLFQLGRESIIGKTDHELFSREVADAFRAFDWKALAARGVVEVEESVPAAAGLRTFLTIKAPLSDAAGEPYALIGIAADITERKRLEEQLRHSQKMEAVGRLAGGIAHDFNNLLGVIVGYSELLGMALAGQAEHLKLLAQITRAAEQAAALTRKLLTFSRRQMTHHKLLDLNVVLRELENMLCSVAGENIELVLQTSVKPCLIRSERDQIEQAILNLVLNARDAMPHGGRLSLNVTPVAVDEDFARLNQPLQPGPHVRLTVSDTGCGMDAETQGHIFEPFFTTKELGKGTGLGLTTVYGTVQQGGGAIVVESEPGKGTSFHIYLPRMKGETTGEQKSAPTRSTRGSETILVVEDEDGIRNLICEFLRLGGYTVLAARHGREALAVAAAHEGRIDLMITDLVMPLMGGWELAQTMGTLRPETRVLYMSGYSDRSNTPLAEGLEFMDKPFAPEAMMQKVRQMLDAPRVLTLPA
jgi:two-component system, cell cycle sensor histidine kinase and response regulator CckA